MKFSCDACGAQYMIADEKIGPRGVKVRCKKCANVIILRPSREEPVGPPTKISPARKLEVRPSRAALPDPPPPPPPDESEDSDATIAQEPKNLGQHADAPRPVAAEAATVAAIEAHRSAPAASAAIVAVPTTGAISLPSEALSATSSEFGLSVEFAAAGFDEPTAQFSPRQRQQTLSVGLDVAKVSPPPSDGMASPFTGRITAGGSLHSSEIKKAGNGSSGAVLARAGLGAKLPAMDEDEVSDPALATRVDGKAIPPRAGDDDEDENDNDDEVARNIRTAVNNHLAATSDEDIHDNVTIDRDNFLDRQERKDRQNGHAGAGAARIESTFGDTSDSEAMARAEFEQRLAERLKNIGPHGDGLRSTAAVSDEPSDRDDPRLQITDSGARGTPDRDDASDEAREPTDRSQSLAAASRVATESNEDTVDGARVRGDHLHTESPSPQIGPSSNGSADASGAELGSGLLENEISDAFDSVFGGVAGAQGTNGARANEDPFAQVAARESDGDGDDDRLSTRVFDDQAMERVQREQQMASSRPARSSAPAPSAKPEPREWYVAINDQQVGPLTISDVRDRWDAKEVDASSLCWKPGMADWIAIRFVKDLEAVAGGPSARTTVSRGGPPDVRETARDPVVTAAPEQGAREETSRASREPTAAAGPMPQKPALIEVAESATATEEVNEPSEPSWRPSAASALASLAAEELGDTSSPDVAPTQSKRPKKGGLPGGDGAISALLDDKGADKGASHLFGAAELSSSKVMRPLPKAGDPSAAVSFRDPGAMSRDRGGVSVPVMLFGAVVLVVAVVAIMLWMFRAPPAMPPQPQIAQAAPPAAAPPKVIPPVAPPVEAAPAAVPAPAETVLAAAPVPSAPAEAAPPPAAEETKVKGKVKEGSGAKGKRENRDPDRDRDRDRDRDDEPIEAVAPKIPTPSAEPPAAAPPPPPPPEKKDFTADDLLNEGRARVKPETAEPGLPDQLDDATVFRVLRGHKEDIKNCLAKQSEADPTLDGVMKVNLVILTNGRTSRHSVAPDKFKSSVVARCVVDSVRGWSFPKFTGDPMPVDFPVTVRGK